jgi:hypothetical protein
MRLSVRTALALCLLAGCKAATTSEWPEELARSPGDAPAPEAPTAATPLTASDAMDAPFVMHAPLDPDPPIEPAFDPTKTKEFGSHEDKSYWIPAVEIIAFEAALNLYDRGTDERTYGSSWQTIDQNLQSAWVIDSDPFATNQLLHPYAGSIYHAFARSAGLNYWESMVYTFAGSALWEVAGETTRPSLNDQVATGIAGSFLGEAFFRASSWILERGGTHPGFFRNLGAAIVSPPNFVNRRVFGKRFEYLFPSREAAVSSRVGLGAKRSKSPVERSSLGNEWGTDGILQLAMDYGMPGRRDYAYSHPFDYFHIDFAGSTDPDNHVDHLFVQGLLVGDDYRSGQDFDGIWGLYGSYAYLSPGVFRAASTALSLGTTVQDRTNEWMTLQGSLLGGFGFGAGGTISSDQSDRDYHYGATPQAMLDGRCILGDVVMLQLTGHDYSIGGAGYNHNGGTENVLQVEGAMTVRVYGGHAIRLACSGDWRHADYENAPTQRQSVATVSVAYAYLGGIRLAAVH